MQAQEETLEKVQVSHFVADFLRLWFLLKLQTQFLKKYERSNLYFDILSYFIDRCCNLLIKEHSKKLLRKEKTGKFYCQKQKKKYQTFAEMIPQSLNSLDEQISFDESPVTLSISQIDLIHFPCYQYLKNYSQDLLQLILVSIKMYRLQRSPYKTPLKYANQKIDPSIIQGLITSIKKVHNPYVIFQYSQKFMRWDLTSMADIEDISYLTKQKEPLLREIKRAASEIYNFYAFKHLKKEPIRAKIFEMLKHRIQQINDQLYKYRKWEGAQIMLNSQPVKRLPLNFMKELVQLFEQKKYQQIHTFFKDTLYKSKLINNNQFQTYIKNKSILVRNISVPLKDFDELIRVIKKTAPAEDISSVILIQKLKKYKQLEGATIQILDPNPEQTVNGRIIQAEYKDKRLQLKLKRMKSQLYVLVQLDNKEKAITQVSVQQFVFVPIQNLIKIENKRHWQKIQNLSTNATSFYLIKMNCQVQLNNSQFTKFLIPSGFYNIFCKTDIKNDESRYQLWFQQSGYQEAKTLHLQILVNSSFHQKVIVYEGKKSLYKQFIRSYEVKESKRYEINNEDQSLEKSIKIYKFFSSSDNTYLYQKLNSIQRKKNKIINKLKFKQFKNSNVFKRYILSGEIDCDELKKMGIMTEIEEIIGDYIQIEQTTSEQELIQQLIANFNYASFVPKQQTLKSISMIKHFVSSQKAVQSMIGKVIITLLGNTGSGKSTTADYLIGVPLKESKNCYGDKIIEIDQHQAKLQKLDVSSIAKIGHSCVLSQTIYSRGHSILKKKHQNIRINKDIILCDNPGFEDTRGLFFQVCTRLSMDRAFYLCKSISKVVLVLPQQIIKSQKSIHLINIITQIYERFEQLSDFRSNQFKNFYILITKARESQENMQLLEEYFKDTLCEYKNHFQRVSSNLRITEQSIIKDKIMIFTNLLKMIGQKRIIYLHVTSEVDRIDILFQLGAISDPDQKQKIAETQNQLKNKYKRCLDDKYLRQFAHEVSICAHTLSEVILKEYLYKMPADIEEIKKEIHKVRTAIAKHKLLIEQSHKKYQQQQKIKQSKQILIHKNKLVISDIEKNVSSEIQKSLQQSMAKNQSKYRQYKKHCEQTISREKATIAEYQAEVKKIVQNRIVKEKKLSDINQKYLQISKQIQTWKKAVVSEEILAICYQLNEEIKFKNQKDSFRVGKNLKKLRRTVRLKKDYKIQRNEQFDPSGQIQKFFKFGKYKAKIESRNMTLEGVKLMADGSKYLVVIQEFNVTNKKEQLPYFKITYQLPGEENYSDAIKNKNAELVKLFKQKSQLQMEIGIQTSKQQRQTWMIQFKEKAVKQKEQQKAKIEVEIKNQQKAELVKLRKNCKEQHERSIIQEQQQIKSIQNSIEQCSNLIKERQNQIHQLQKELYCKCKPTLQNTQTPARVPIFQNNYVIMRKPLVKEENKDTIGKKFVRTQFKRQFIVNPNHKPQATCQCKKLEEKLKQKQWTRKRMAFLIKDQLTKGIPQTLKKFIDFTQILKMQNHEYKTQIFAKFKQMFDKQEATLLKRVEWDLKNS